MIGYADIYADEWEMGYVTESNVINERKANKYRTGFHIRRYASASERTENEEIILNFELILK